MPKEMTDAEILRRAGQIIGSIKSAKKAKAARENGKRGGRPKGSKNKQTQGGARRGHDTK